MTSAVGHRRAAGVPVYGGTFGAAEAERLLWRAGFGPRPGEAAALAALGLDGAVDSLVRPPAEHWVGPDPRDEFGNPLAPYDVSGHDHLWWLDRMVRTSRPLVERMTLLWHTWFATSNSGVGSQRLMLRQNLTLRRNWLGRFDALLDAVTVDPAMLVWLNGNRNTRTQPNENYARELMELFTLGAGRGYTERDVREQARALAGWWNDYVRGVGPTNFRFRPENADTGAKTVFGRTGRFDWRDACRLCVEHPAHASFAVGKLWRSFVPASPDPATQAALERLYTASGRDTRAVVAAILRHPDLYTGPRMVKQPVVYLAGLLRALGRPVDTSAWAGLCNIAGQRLFYPPNVAGWSADAWLDTGTFRARAAIVALALRPVTVQAGAEPGPAVPEAMVDRAAQLLGATLRPATRDALVAFARDALASASGPAARRSTPASTENALRWLVGIAPEQQAA